MKVFHRFEIDDRRVVLCGETTYINTDFIEGTEINIGWAILRPGDKEKVVIINKQPRNYGEVLAEGRATKKHKRYSNIAVISQSITHRAVVEAMLVSFEHYMRKNLHEFVAAL